MKKHQKITAWFCFAMLLLFQLVGCNGLGVNPVDKNVLLQQRLESYIEARIKSDLVQLSKLYLEPRSAKFGNIVIKESRIVSIEIADNGLTAMTKIENKINAMGFTFNKVPLVLNWVWENHNWYIKPAQSAKTQFMKK